ncbi:MAG: DUF3237 domain-containing protein [Spirochaetia bacterium]
MSGVTQAGAQTKAVGTKLRLEYLMTFHGDFVPPVDIGQITAGHRQIFVISGGSFEGPKLRGKILPGPVDWFITSSDGVGHMDVRGTLQTDDGANIYMRYEGVQVMTAAAGAKISKGEIVDFGEVYWLATPVFETGDPRYSWLNNIVTVAEARLGPNAAWFEYRVFQVLD